MDVTVKKTDPQMKMSLRPYTSANLPHSNYTSVSREFSRIDVRSVPGSNQTSGCTPKRSIAAYLLVYQVLHQWSAE